MNGRKEARMVAEKMGRRALEIFDGAQEFGTCLDSLAAAKVERKKAVADYGATDDVMLAEVNRLTSMRAAKNAELRRANEAYSADVRASWVAGGHISVPDEVSPQLFGHDAWYKNHKERLLALTARQEARTAARTAADAEHLPKINALKAESAALDAEIKAAEVLRSAEAFRARKLIARWDGIISFCRDQRGMWARNDGDAGPHNGRLRAYDMIVNGY